MKTVLILVVICLPALVYADTWVQVQTPPPPSPIMDTSPAPAQTPHVMDYRNVAPSQPAYVYAAPSRVYFSYQAPTRTYYAPQVQAYQVQTYYAPQVQVYYSTSKNLVTLPDGQTTYMSGGNRRRMEKYIRKGQPFYIESK